MQLPRMTTRRWMVAVAVVGLLMGVWVLGYRLKRRRDYFLDCARYHRQIAYWRSEKVPHWVAILKRQIDLRERIRLETETARLTREMAYHTVIAGKYEHAARYPWLPVEPDPPEPDWDPCYPPLPVEPDAHEPE